MRFRRAQYANDRTLGHWYQLRRKQTINRAFHAGHAAAEVPPDPNAKQSKVCNDGMGERVEDTRPAELKR
eukprot:8310774-Pyramimonas_sp.AAC.1